MAWESIATQTARLTPEQRQENARHAAKMKHKKLREAKEKEQARFSFEIKYDKPVPPPKRNNRKSLVYSFFDKIDVGGSFEIQDEKTYKMVYHAAGVYGRKTGKTFVGRKLDVGFGIWRVK